MMTDDELKVGYMRKFNRVLTPDNMTSLKKFIRNFELEDYTDFDEMYEAIKVSMRDISRELENSHTTLQTKEILHRRYGKLG